MRNRLVMLSTCLVMALMLACNLSVRTPPPVPTQEDQGLSLTVTALTKLVQVTPSPMVWTATPELATDIPGPLPTAPELVRLVTGVSAAYFASPPVTDGQLNEWAQSWFVVASPVYGIENWRGVNDLSGSAAFGWDEDYFYIAMRVTDDTYVQNANSTQIYKGDSVEILFDADLAGDYYENTLSDDDFQLGISPGNPSVGFAPEAYQWLPPHLEGSLHVITIVALPTDVGYDLEAVIPWSVFGILPQAWQHYGFAISLSDNDKDGTTIQQSMVSNTPDRRLTKPMTWGDLVLIK